MSESDAVEFWWSSAEEKEAKPKRPVKHRAPRSAVGRFKPGAQGKHDARGKGDNRKRPPSRTAKAILAVLTDHPQRAAEIRAQAPFAHNEMHPALYSLQQHGLAERTPSGWVRK